MAASTFYRRSPKCLEDEYRIRLKESVSNSLVHCECGMTYAKNNKTNHYKSERHKIGLELYKCQQTIKLLQATIKSLQE